MNMATSLLPLTNITIPHILPIILIFKNDHDLDNAPLLWEADDDFQRGLEVMFTHLDTVRLITQQYGLYRVTAENVMREFSVNRDLLDMLKTETHLRLLWGAKGAWAPPSDRYSKLGQVLRAFSCKFEPDMKVVDRETSL